MHKNNLKKLIAKYERQVQKLKEKQASFGLHAPTYISIEIEDLETEIRKLQLELAQLNEIPVDESHDRVGNNFFTLWAFLGGVLITALLSITIFFLLNNGRTTTNSEITGFTPCFQDDFTANTNGWNLDKKGGTKYIVRPQIANGKYIRSETYNVAPYVNWTPTVPICFPKDFELSVEATIVEADYLEDNEAAIAISFRNSPGYADYYYVLFSNAGYLVSAKKDDESVPISN